MTATWKILTLLLAAAAADAPLESAREYVDRGMRRFRNNDIAGSLRDFDRAAALEPEAAPHLWQRGISHYYVARFADGRRQFESHQKVNPHDVENAAWHFVCVARLDGLDAARKALIGINTDRDTRIPMREIYKFYAGRGSADAVLAAAKRSEGERAHMYAHLYLGLYYEVAGEVEKAKRHMRAAASANLDANYMHDVARVHLRQREWHR